MQTDLLKNVNPTIGNTVLADAAVTEEARNFLLAHDRDTLMHWKNHTKEEKVRWIKHLMPKENASPFWGECIRLIYEGYS